MIRRHRAPNDHHFPTLTDLSQQVIVDIFDIEHRVRAGSVLSPYFRSRRLEADRLKGDGIRLEDGSKLLNAADGPELCQPTEAAIRSEKRRGGAEEATS